jgi:hypothetical protein
MLRKLKDRLWAFAHKHEILTSAILCIPVVFVMIKVTDASERTVITCDRGFHATGSVSYSDKTNQYMIRTAHHETISYKPHEGEMCSIKQGEVNW